MSELTRRGALAATAGLAAACAQNIDTPPYEGVVAFNHGVASGDPRHDRVIIWTRVTPDQAGPVPVRWIVSRNRELTDVVKTGVVETNEARDYTVKADVTGLRAGAPYFYGFRAGEAASAIGKTRTLPRGRLDELKIGVVSCASYPHGFFNAYEALARRDDVDLVVHLGDYIYEYGLAGYGGDIAVQLGRVPTPDVECLRVQDYRLRHAQYKTEVELQAAHAIAPWGTTTKSPTIPSAWARKTISRTKASGLIAGAPRCKPITNGCRSANPNPAARSKRSIAPTSSAISSR
jgi:alkaline phosphatase D